MQWKIFILISICLTLHTIPFANPEYNTEVPEECSTNNTSQTSILPLDYQRGRLPPLGGGPVNVSVEVSVNDILLVDENKKVIRIQVELRFSWRDVRFLTPKLFCFKNFEFVDKDAMNFLWRPDLWIDRLHAAQSLKGAMLNNAGTMQMWRHQRLVISLPFNIDVSCKMEFYNYPMDTQYCLVQLMSYGYNTKKNQYEWGGEGLLVRPGITLNKYNVEVRRLPGTKITDYLGEYPTLAFVVVLSRNTGDQFLSIYVPSTLFMITAWLSFLVPPEKVPGRMTLCVTVLLTTVALFAYSKVNSPKVSYSTALDVWMVACIVLVFVALLEFVLVIYLISLEDKAHSAIPSLSTKRPMSIKVETTTIILFPIAFLSFCIIYWAYYISSLAEMPDMTEQLED